MPQWTKGHVTIGDMINLDKEVLGKFTFQRLPCPGDPADGSAGPFVRHIFVARTFAR
jgi:hypothetical protein